MAVASFFVQDGLNVNNFVKANSSVLSVGANVAANATAYFVGNATVNAIVTQSTIAVGTLAANSTVLTAGIFTANATVVTVGANVIANTTAYFVGNATVNAIVTSASIALGAFVANATVAQIGANAYINSTSHFVGNATVNSVMTSTTMTVSNSTSNTIQGPGGITYPDGNQQARAAYGIQEIWIPAAAMWPRTTNPAVANTYETSTNKVNFPVLDFNASTNSFAQFSIKMPKSWNGSTVLAQFAWLQAGTTSNFTVMWSLAGTSYSSANVADIAMGTLQSVTSNGAVNNAVYITGNTAAITIGNSPSSQDLCVFEVKRTPGDASDTLAIDARLIGVTLYVTTNQTNDA